MLPKFWKKKEPEVELTPEERFFNAVLDEVLLAIATANQIRGMIGKAKKYK